MTIARSLKWILGIIGTLIMLIVLMDSLFSDLVDEPSRDEVARVVSPNGKIDAVLFETNAGATTSFGYEIYVVEHATQPSASPAISLYGAIRSPSAYGANLRWESSTSLIIEFLNAKSRKIRKSSVSIEDQVIQLTVRDGISDNAAPSGGMLYNLRGRQ